jgi:hypothetical protein
MDIFSLILFWHLCWESVGSTCVYLFLCPLFCSIGQHVCFYVNTMLFLLLWLYSIFWNKYCDTFNIALSTEDYFYCLGSVVLPYEFWDCFFLVLWRIITGILMGVTLNLYIVFGSMLYGYLNNINFHYPWTWEVFPSSSVFFTFFFSAFYNFHCSSLSLLG